MNQEPSFDRDGIRMLPAEKAALRSRVIRRAPSRVRVPAFRFAFAPAFAALAILLVGSSVTFAAQLSGPGDLLHPLETGVIEPVEGFLYGNDAQGAYRLARLGERLDEFKDLDPGELSDEEVQVEVRNLASHADGAVEAARDEHDLGLRVGYLVRISALLEANEDVLASLSDSTDIVPVGDAISEELAGQVEAYTQGKGQEELAGIVSDRLDEAGSLIASSSAGLASESADDLHDVSEQIADQDFDDALQIVTQLQVSALAEQYATQQ